MSLRPLDGGVGNFPPVGGEGVNLICTTDALLELLSLSMDDVLVLKLSLSNELFRESGFNFAIVEILNGEDLYCDFSSDFRCKI